MCFANVQYACMLVVICSFVGVYLRAERASAGAAACRDLALRSIITPRHVRQSAAAARTALEHCRLRLRQYHMRSRFQTEFLLCALAPRKKPNASSFRSQLKYQYTSGTEVLEPKTGNINGNDIMTFSLMSMKIAHE